MGLVGLAALLTPGEHNAQQTLDWFPPNDLGSVGLIPVVSRQWSHGLAALDASLSSWKCGIDTRWDHCTA